MYKLDFSDLKENLYMKPYRVIHFVSGGGSGSTAMTVALASGNHSGATFEPMIIFRRKERK